MKNISIKSLLTMVNSWLGMVRAYVGVLIFLMFAVVYGLVILEINRLSNPEIDDATVLSQAKATLSPHLDARAARQLEALKDNSVNVQTLFDQNRTNPFQE